MGYIQKILTYTIESGAEGESNSGFRSIDLFNNGDSVAYFKGTADDSDWVPLQPQTGWSLEFAATGWDLIYIDNTSNNDTITVIEKY